MAESNFYLFGILLLLATLSESRVIVRRGIQNFGNSGNGEIPYSLNPLGSANKPVFGPEISNKPIAGDDFGIYEYDVQPFDYAYERPGEVDKKGDNGGPKINPEKFPSDTDHTEGPPLKDIDEKDDGILNKNPGTDKLGDDEAYEPFDYDLKGPADESGSKPVEDEDKSIPKEEEESHVDEKHEDDVKEEDDKKDRVPEEDDDGSEEHDKDDDGKSEEHDKGDDRKSEENGKDDDGKSEEHDKDDDGKSEEHDKDDDGKSEEHNKDDDGKSGEHDEGDDEKSGEHDEGDDDKDIHATEDAKPLSGGSVFDTPFFNYERVKNYFGLLDKALGHAFQETLEEAKLLNGTYANTTEEEVDIGGKKYVVQKSVIKSADNHSTIYVETLNTKPKETDDEEVKNTELKNATNV